MLLPNGNDCRIGENDRGFQATHRSRGATVGAAGCRTDNQPSKENASLLLKTWIYAEKTEPGTDLFPPATEIFVKLKARVPAKRRCVRAKRSKRAAKPSSASDGSSTGPSRIARRNPAIGSSPSPACHRPNGAAYALRMQSNGYTRSSSAGSRRRSCCGRQTRPPCCSGRCSPPARSTCERSMLANPCHKAHRSAN